VWSSQHWVPLALKQQPRSHTLPVFGGIHGHTFLPVDS
jgi:hypothetical protein